MRAPVHLLAALLLHGALCAQVGIDRSVELTGAEPADRRIERLDPSTQGTDALSAGVAQGGAVNTSLADPGDVWSVELPAFGEEPSTGSHVMVRVPAVSASPISILFNGTGPIPVVYEGLPLMGDVLVEGSMLSLVLANGVFHVLNGDNDMRRSCPQGTVAVNGQYCIEPTERGSGDYFQAGLGCASAGLRLCTWAEFVAACDRSLELQLVDMTNSWEWTNNTSNEDNSARIVGLNGCQTAGNWLSTGSAPIAYRCCYTR
jgi:hypothetical protein